MRLALRYLKSTADDVIDHVTSVVFAAETEAMHIGQSMAAATRIEAIFFLVFVIIVFNSLTQLFSFLEIDVYRLRFFGLAKMIRRSCATGKLNRFDCQSLNYSLDLVCCFSHF